MNPYRKQPGQARLLKLSIALTFLGAFAFGHAGAAPVKTWTAVGPCPNSASSNAGCTDPTTGSYMGGTEGRQFAVLNGGTENAQLFWAAGYWEDTPGAEGAQNGYVAFKAYPTDLWHKSLDLSNFCPADNTNCAHTVSALQTLNWQWDSGGNAVSVSTLVAAQWWQGSSALVGCGSPNTPVYSFTMNNADKLWYATQVVCDTGAGSGSPQIRSYGVHTDQVNTHDQKAFAGEAATGVFIGTLSTTRAAGNALINWSTGAANAEWLASSYTGPACTNQVRPMAFTEATGSDAVLRIYMSACWNVYVRIDGPTPGTHSCNAQQVDNGTTCVARWQLYWTDPEAGLGATSESGARGLTAVTAGTELLSGAEGTLPQHIYRIPPYPACGSPTGGCETPEIDIGSTLGGLQNAHIGSTIAPYNQFALVYDNTGTGRRVFGTTNYITAATTSIPSFLPFNASFLYLGGTGSGKKLGEACYFYRTTNPIYNWECLPQLFTTAMNGIRDMIASPWPSECNNGVPPGSTNNPGWDCAIYATGYDSDGATQSYWCTVNPCTPSYTNVHGTAWIARFGYPLPTPPSCVPGSRVYTVPTSINLKSVGALGCAKVDIYVAGAGGASTLASTSRSGATGAGGNWAQLVGITDPRLTSGDILYLTFGAGSNSVSDSAGVFNGPLFAENGGAAFLGTEGVQVPPATTATAAGATLTTFEGAQGHAYTGGGGGPGGSSGAGPNGIGCRGGSSSQTPGGGGGAGGDDSSGACAVAGTGLGKSATTSTTSVAGGTGWGGTVAGIGTATPGAAGGNASASSNGDGGAGGGGGAGNTAGNGGAGGSGSAGAELMSLTPALSMGGGGGGGGGGSCSSASCTSGAGGAANGLGSSGGAPGQFTTGGASGAPGAPSAGAIGIAWYNPIPNMQLIGSWAAPTTDINGVTLGGTELRALTTHNGCMWAGNSYWEYQPSPLGAQVFSLCSINTAWKQDHNFGTGVEAIVSLGDHTFTTYGSGAAISSPWPIMTAGAWNSNGDVYLYDRNDTSNAWRGNFIITPPHLTGIPQIRSKSCHVDNTTAIDICFAGVEPTGIYSYTLNAGGTPSSYAFSAFTLELDTTNFAPQVHATGGCSTSSTIITTSGTNPGLRPATTYYVYNQSVANATTAVIGTLSTWTGSTITLTANASHSCSNGDIMEISPWQNFSTMEPRPMSMTTCTNQSGVENIYATVASEVYKRNDGVTPTWSLVYTVPAPSSPYTSNEGLRGLTCISNPNITEGHGALLMTLGGGEAAETQHPEVLLLDINTGTATVDADLHTLINAASPSGYGAFSSTTGSAYVLSAYNGMVPWNGGVLFGLTTSWAAGGTAPTNIKIGTPFAYGSTGENVVPNAAYVYRDSSGGYTLCPLPQIYGTGTGQPMLATRALSPSAFASEPNTFYLGGPDAYATVAGNNRAWIAKFTISATQICPL